MCNNVAATKLNPGERFVTKEELELMEKRYEEARSTWTDEQRANECWGKSPVLLFSDGWESAKIGVC